MNKHLPAIISVVLLITTGCATSAAPDLPAAAPEAAIAAPSHCSRGCPTGAPQINKTVRHAFYTLSNNGETKFADWVAYVVQPDLIGGPDRPRNWKKDPDLDASVTLETPDYTGFSDLLGMDRGHQAPLEAFTRSPDWREANYLSNITPQNSNLNGGRWSQLEAAERRLAQAKNAGVYVVTGPLYEKTMPVLPNADETHRIPSGYWKVISMRSGGAIGFVFSQAPAEGGYCARIKPISEIEARSHLDLFPNAASNPSQLDRAELGC
jgi:endonuclease G, mitochondrial